MSPAGQNDVSVVFVVDDDQAVREALSSLIRSVGLAVETYASAHDFLLQRRHPDERVSCLVLDVRMDGMSGLGLQDELARSGNPVPIIFITGHGDIPMTVRAIKAGAVEFLPKPFRDQDLLDAIAVSLHSDRQLRAQRDAVETLHARYNLLTAREREVLELTIAGLRNKQMAYELGIAEVTVKVHRHNIMEKMRAPSIPALIAMMNRLGDAKVSR